MSNLDSEVEAANKKVIAELPFDHPEIERTSYLNLATYVEQCGVVQTQVDVVSISRQAQGNAIGYDLCRNLSHEELVEHMKDSAQTNTIPDLRIVFLSSSSGTTLPVKLHPKTIEFLMEEAGVSPIFLSGILAPPSPLMSFADALLKKRTTTGNTESVSSIQGYIRYPEVVEHGPHSVIWFRHDLKNHKSTYIIQCPHNTKEEILRWPEPNRAGLLQPLTLDAFMLNEASSIWAEKIDSAEQRLLEIEKLGPNPPDSILSAATAGLHELSYDFHIIEGRLEGLDDKAEYLLKALKIVEESQDSHIDAPARDSLALLRSRTRSWNRWVKNEKTRTSIRINLFFNVLQQRGNDTNATIAQETKQITIETQKDSASMITIAALTLLFLPGSFVATIFSMVFFDTSYSHLWWIYPTITVPLTLIIIVTWLVWKSRRSTDGTGSGGASKEKGGDRKENSFEEGAVGGTANDVIASTGRNRPASLNRHHESCRPRSLIHPQPLSLLAPQAAPVIPLLSRASSTKALSVRSSVAPALDAHNDGREGENDEENLNFSRLVGSIANIRYEPSVYPEDDDS